jgi:hypothetical protein
MTDRPARVMFGATVAALVAWYVLVIGWGPQWAMCHDSLNFLYEALRLPHEGRIGSYVHGPFVYEIVAAFEAAYYVVLRIVGQVQSPNDHLVHVLTHMPFHVRGIETLMAIGGCATTVMVYRVGRLFGGRATGAAAALLCAANATFLIMTSFAKEDVFFWCFLFLAMDQAWAAAESQRTAPAIRSGAAIGAAVAVKYFAVFGVPLILLPLIRASGTTRLRGLQVSAIMAASSAVTLVALFPFLFTDTSTVLMNIHDTNAGYAVMSRQLALGAYLQAHLPNVAGWFVMIAGAAEIVRLLAKHPRGPIVLAVIPIALFLFLSLRPGFSLAYYAMPMALMLFVLAASAVTAAARAVPGSWRPVVWIAASLVLLTDPFLPGAVKYSLLLTGPDTRLLARDAVVSRAKPGDCVLVNLAVAGENFFGPPLVSTRAPAGSGPFAVARSVANERMPGPKFDVRTVDGEVSPTPEAASGCQWLVLGSRGQASFIELGLPPAPPIKVVAPPGYEAVAAVSAFPEEHSRNFPLYTSIDYDALRESSIVRFFHDRAMGPSFEIYRRSPTGAPAP